MPKAVITIASGTRFGKLVVLGPGERSGYGRATIRCRCDCGRTRDFPSWALRSGGATTCAQCPKAQHPNNRVAVIAANRKHGMTGTTEFYIWSGLLRRCTDPQDRAYPRYGGRGIKVCPRWADSFEAFFADMGLRPSKDHTLDRVDNDAGYDPENCRWATWEEQNRKRSNTLFVETASGRVPFGAVISHKHPNYGLVHYRVFRAGWSLEEAINTPRLRTRRP